MRYDFAQLLNGDRTDRAMLRACLLDARQRTRALTDDLDGQRELGPHLPIVNPPLWELGHIAWFQEHWCLRFNNTGASAASMIANADPVYNSAIAAHATRWSLPLLSWSRMRAYQDTVLEKVLARLEQTEPDEQLHYLIMLSVFHEDMHGEAFLYTRQTLGYPCPRILASADTHSATRHASDAHFIGGTMWLGAPPGIGFAFDNERNARKVDVAAFSIASAPVSIGDFAAFVEAQGYTRDELWSDAGRTWRDAHNVQTPLYWRSDSAKWWLREFDRWVALDQRASAPMLFVNAFEAEAYCRWAGRRLPTEAECEFFARQTQSVATATIDDLPDTTRYGWEWTSDSFQPYPGFVPGPYAEYSAPWFDGQHRVLRGSCFATRERMRRPSYRNFYTPDRRDVLAGFRTCALDSN